jgi:hypothetical protein
MALVLKDRVQETTTTTGTGTLTLGGAVLGYQTFAAIGNANTTYYTISSATSSEWEVGLGTYTASGTTLSRDTVLSSSNSGSAVVLSAGTKNVFCTYPSSKAAYVSASGPTDFATTTNTQFNSLGVGTPGSAVTGEIRATNNVTAYYSSDAKFKENIRDIPNALEIVKEIGGQLFDWTDEYIAAHGGEDGYFVQKADFGHIAQKVQEHFPLASRTKEDGSLAVDYQKMCALAFAAIKELDDKLEALTKDRT